MRASASLAMLDAPYSGLAHIYDQVIGSQMFPIVRRAFEHCRKLYGIDFESAADVGCGTGMFLKHLAKLCRAVVGVDSSPAMLALAKNRIADRPVVLLQQNLKALKLPYPVDLITCNLDTLNYLHTPADLARAFRQFNLNLTGRGHLVFDLIAGTRDPTERMRETQRINLPGIASIWNVATDPARGISVVDMCSRVVDPRIADRRWREVHVQRWYPVPLVRRALCRTGFRVRGVHDMATLRRAGPDVFWAHFTARKTFDLDSWR